MKFVWNPKEQTQFSQARNGGGLFPNIDLEKSVCVFQGLGFHPSTYSRWWFFAHSPKRSRDFLGFPFSWGRIGPHERVDWNPKLRIAENFFHRLGRLSCEPKNMATNSRDFLVLGWLMLWVMRLLLQCSLAENQSTWMTIRKIRSF